jgi:soluble lytic murein transglycosylase
VPAIFKSIALTFFCVLITSTEALSRTEEENGLILAAAVNAAGRGDWDGAADLASRSSEKNAATYIEWLRLRDGVETDLAVYDRFLDRHADWPGLDLVRYRSEGAIAFDAAPGRVIARFADTIPDTGIGTIRLADAYLARGDRKTAESVAIHAWITMAMTRDERTALFSRFEKALQPHHVERLDMLLWRGLQEQAEGLYTLVPDGWVKLSKARLGLRRSVAGVDTLIAEVPKALQDDAGMAYERFMWRVRKGRYDDARDLMVERSGSADSLGRPDEWSERRRAYARQEMRDGNFKRAYALASRHYLTSGSDYADLEWLAGYIALRMLNDPTTAIRHFSNFHGEVETPISLGRAGYWLGRAWEAAGNMAEAEKAYAMGARHQTSFYGQLAAEKIGAPGDPTLVGNDATPNWRLASFLDSDVLKTALLLVYAGRTICPPSRRRSRCDRLAAIGGYCNGDRPSGDCRSPVEKGCGTRHLAEQELFSGDRAGD